MSTSPLVVLDHLNVFLPGTTDHTPLLHDICWTLHQQEHTALMGPNGAGKSTLLRVLHGELWPASGTLLWYTDQGVESSLLAGRALSALVSPALQERYQRQRWYISGQELLLTGYEETSLLYTSAPEERLAEVEQMARELHALDLLGRPLPELSQGQLRLLLLARALLRQPRLLLFDECLDGLDQQHRRLFLPLLEREIERHQSTVVFTCHRAEQVPDWCKTSHAVCEGRLFPASSPAEQHSNTLPSPTADVPSPVPAALPSLQTAEPLLCLQNATVYCDGEAILHDLNWRLYRGEHWRIDGENGSGKSTFLRLLAGDAFVAAGGSLTRFLPSHGGATTRLEDIRRAVRLVSDLSQAEYGYDISALELVCSGFDNSIGIYRDYSEAEQAEALRLMQDFAVAHLATSSLRRVSTGQLRRLFLARALAGSPDVLLLDEPCSGLDPQGREEYLAQLCRLAGQGISLVFVSHENEEPACINRRARMVHGRLSVCD